jgi:hypothetical protein
MRQYWYLLPIDVNIVLVNDSVNSVLSFEG